MPPDRPRHYTDEMLDITFAYERERRVAVEFGLKEVKDELHEFKREVRTKIEGLAVKIDEANDDLTGKLKEQDRVRDDARKESRKLLIQVAVGIVTSLTAIGGIILGVLNLTLG